VTTFSTKSFQGRANARHGRARSRLDKGTLAAAHIGLVRAGQRPPDRRAAPCQARCSVRAEVPEAGGSTARSAAVTTRATASTGE